MLVNIPRAMSNIKMWQPVIPLIPQNNEQPLNLSLGWRPDIPSHSASPLEIMKVMKLLGEIKQLPPNWDGYGALTINDRTVTNTEVVLKKLIEVLPVPEITPNANGTISLEWESNQGNLAHLEIGMTRFSFYTETKSGVTTTGDGYIVLADWSVYARQITSLLSPPCHGTAETMSRFCFSALSYA